MRKIKPSGFSFFRNEVPCNGAAQRAVPSQSAMRAWGLGVGGLASVLLLGACAGPGTPSRADAAGSRGDTTAIAMLNPASGSKVNGIVRMRQSNEWVVMQVRVAGLPPNGEFGFHVHERGDCSAADASSAGAHLNPNGVRHGSHPGDLPSLRSDASGVAETRFEVKGSLLGAGAADFMGKALIVHADRDDGSDPAGNSGARVACGVINSPERPGGVGGNSEAKTIPKQM